MIQFNNFINYMVVSPSGDVLNEGVLKNAVGGRVKDQIMRGLTTPSGGNAGTILPVGYISYRCDGSTVLGSFEQWFAATAFSTRYNSSTYVTSVGYSATYTATTTTTVKSVILQENVGWSSAVDVGSLCLFYSTSLNLTAGSASRIIINWTVGVS